MTRATVSLLSPPDTDDETSKIAIGNRRTAWKLSALTISVINFVLWGFRFHWEQITSTNWHTRHFALLVNPIYNTKRLIIRRNFLEPFYSCTIGCLWLPMKLLLLKELDIVLRCCPQHLLTNYNCDQVLLNWY